MLPFASGFQPPRVPAKTQLAATYFKSGTRDIFFVIAVFFAARLPVKLQEEKKKKEEAAYNDTALCGRLMNN